MGFLGRVKDGIQKFNLWIVVVVAFGVYITFFSDYNYFRSMEYDARIKDLKAQIKECDDSTIASACACSRATTRRWIALSERNI